MNDNETFLQLQEDYIKNGSAVAWSKMWLLCLDISKRLIMNERNKKGFFLPFDEIENKSMDAVLYVLRRYKTRKNYKIKYIVTTMRFGVIHALYCKSANDLMNETALSLQDFFSI